MGEHKLAPVKAVNPVAAACQETINTMVEAADQAMRVRTPGGVFSVRWDEQGSATALGQLAFFAEYLEATGLFERWLKSCPLSYTSPNAPELVDVLGTWMLSILDGHCRYAHVGALRGDGVAPRILGMNKIQSATTACAGRWGPSHRRPMPSTLPSSARRKKRSMRARCSGCRSSSSTALRRPPPRRGFWIATRRSRCSTANKTVPWSATTRTNRGGPATPSTPTGSATCAW